MSRRANIGGRGGRPRRLRGRARALRVRPFSPETRGQHRYPSEGSFPAVSKQASKQGRAAWQNLASIQPRTRYLGARTPRDQFSWIPRIAEFAGRLDAVSGLPCILDFLVPPRVFACNSMNRIVEFSLTRSITSRDFRRVPSELRENPAYCRRPSRDPGAFLSEARGAAAPGVPARVGLPERNA